MEEGGGCVHNVVVADVRCRLPALGEHSQVPIWQANHCWDAVPWIALDIGRPQRGAVGVRAKGMHSSTAVPGRFNTVRNCRSTTPLILKTTELRALYAPPLTSVPDTNTSAGTIGHGATELPTRPTRSVERKVIVGVDFKELKFYTFGTCALSLSNWVSFWLATQAKPWPLPSMRSARRT